MNPSIEFINVTKRYRKGRGMATIKDLFKFSRTEPEYHWAVNDVNFSLDPGESIGIIGPNGAGKTTILKLLSKVTTPTSGTINMNGRFSSLIELGAGFHPDLTGRENVFLNGTILGMSRKEIKERFDAIVDFSGIESFIDTPVKRYSSGMNARLGFSIAAHVDPEIMIVDEVLAVGDHAFQMQCYARMDELKAKGTTIVFVSHNMNVVRRVCDRGIVMYQGKPIFQGDAAEAIIQYSDAVRYAAREEQALKVAEGGLSQRVMTFDAEIEKVQLLNDLGESTQVLRSGSRATVAVDVVFNKDVEAPIFAMFIRTPDGLRVYTTTTKWQKQTTGNFSKGDKRRILFDIDMSLGDGTYELGADVAPTDLSCYYDRVERAMSFQVIGAQGMEGLVDLGAQISVQDHKVLVVGSE